MPNIYFINFDIYFCGQNYLLKFNKVIFGD